MLLTSLLESEEAGSDSSSAEDESTESKMRSRGYITGQLFLNLHHCHHLVQKMLLSRLLSFYTSKKQFTNDVNFFFPFCVSYFRLTFLHSHCTNLYSCSTILCFSLQQVMRGGLGVLLGIGFMDFFTYFENDLDKVP